MNSGNELVFRIAFGVLWVVYFITRLYFQRKVQKVKATYTVVNAKQEKMFFRLFALAFILLIFYFLTPWIDFAHFPLPAWARWIGAVITILGIVLFGWSHQVLGRYWTAVLALSEGHRLVTGGPYKYVRHPMYSAFYGIGIGFTVLSANWLVGLIYLGALSVMYFARVAAEEKMMIERFGDEYRQYMQTTGRIFFRLAK